MIDIQKRKQRWIDFADPKSNVNKLIMIKVKELMPKMPMLWWEKKEERIEWAYTAHQVLMENTSWLDDDTVPFLKVITGTEVFAEAFGCDVYYSDINNPCAIPLIKDVSEYNKIKIPQRIEDTKLYNLFEMADKLKDRAGKNAVLGRPDVQTPMDIAALIWDKSDFLMAFYDEPEAVKELSGQIKEFMFKFFDTWTQRYGVEFGAHYPDYYMPCGITMSEDEIGAVSSDIYNEFFKEELHEFANRYGAIGIHCCADSKHQWNNLKQVPNLKVLNLVREDDEIITALDLFRDTCGNIINNTLDFDVSGLADVKQVHIAHHIEVETRAEAIEALKKFKDKYQL